MLSRLVCLYCFLDLFGLFVLFQWFKLALGFVWTVPTVWTVLIVWIGFWKTLDSLDCLYCFLDWVGLFVAFRLWVCLECWVVLVVCITSWIWLSCFDCLDWLCDAWAVLFVYTVSWICLGRLGCVCCPDRYSCWIIFIGFLSVLIVLIIWTVSAVSFFGLLEMFFTLLYKYDLDVFVGSFLIVFLQLFWVFLGLGGPLGVILASFLGPRGPSGLHFGSKSELWGVRGSLLDGWWFQGGLQGEDITFPLPFWGHFGVSLASKITQKSELKFDWFFDGFGGHVGRLLGSLNP